MSDIRATFIEKQERIYGEIAAKRAEVLVHGIRPEVHYRNRRGAFSIALLHSSHVAETFSSVSRMIATCVPAVVYPPCNIHTTLYIARMPAPFLYNPHDSEHQTILRTLVQATGASFAERKPRVCCIEYSRYFLTQEAVLAPGEPDNAFVEMVDLLSVNCEKLGVVGNPAWGAHATVSRFTAQKPASDLGALLKLLERSPVVGTSVCTKIAVGYSLWGPSPECPHPAEVHGHFVPYRTFSIV